MPPPIPVQTYHKQLQRGVAVSNRSKPLLAWEACYAEWFANQDGHSTAAERLDKAQELAQKTMSLPTLYRLQRRPAFKEFVGKMQLDKARRLRKAVDLGRDKMRAVMGEAIDIHTSAMRRAHEVEDYRAAAQITETYLNRAWPKTEAAQQTNVQIVLSSKQEAAFADLDTMTEVLEAEIIEAEPADEEGT